jgi:hypothetical protein
MLRCMRTTLTIDDDVASLLEERRRATGKGLKEIVNDALREALTRRPSRRPERPRRTFRTFSVGELYVGDLDDVSAVLDELDRPRTRR